MTTKDLLNNSTVKELVASAAITTGSNTGSSVDLEGVGRKILVIINTGDVGTGGTLDVEIHESDDDFSADDDTLKTFSQIDSTGVVVGDVAPNKRYIQASYTVGTDTVNCAVIGIIYLEREAPSGL